MINWFLRNFVYRYHYEDIDVNNICIDGTIKEMKKWTEQELGSTRVRVFTVGYATGMFGEGYPIDNFCFKHKEDMMAFKIVWI